MNIHIVSEEFELYELFLMAITISQSQKWLLCGPTNSKKKTTKCLIYNDQRKIAESQL